jgi:hypothetical protein
VAEPEAAAELDVAPLLDEDVDEEDGADDLLLLQPVAVSASVEATAKLPIAITAIFLMACSPQWSCGNRAPHIARAKPARGATVTPRCLLRGATRQTWEVAGKRRVASQRKNVGGCW